MSSRIRDLKASEIKLELEKRNLDISGVKAVLVKRLSAVSDSY